MPSYWPVVHDAKATWFRRRPSKARTPLERARARAPCSLDRTTSSCRLSSRVALGRSMEGRAGANRGSALSPRSPGLSCVPSSSVLRLRAPGFEAALLPRITTGNTGEYRRGLEVLDFTSENGTSRRDATLLRDRCNAFAGEMQRFGVTDVTGRCPALPSPVVRMQLKTVGWVIRRDRCNVPSSGLIRALAKARFPDNLQCARELRT